MNIEPDRYSFVFSQKNDIGLSITFQYFIERNEVIGNLAIPGKYQGWHGLVHGGIIASIMDEAVFRLCQFLGYLCVTADLHIRYKLPVHIDKEVIIVAQLKEINKKIIKCVSLIKEGDSILVESEVTMFIKETTEIK